MILCSVLSLLFDLWVHCCYLVYFFWDDLRIIQPCFSLLMHHVRVSFCLHFHGMYSPSHTPTQPTTLLSLAFQSVQSVRGVEGEADSLAPGGGGNGFASGGANQSGTNESSSMGDGVREFFSRWTRN